MSNIKNDTIQLLILSNIGQSDNNPEELFKINHEESLPAPYVYINLRSIHLKLLKKEGVICLQNFLKSRQEIKMISHWEKYDIEIFINSIKELYEFPLYQIVKIVNVIEGLLIPKPSQMYFSNNVMQSNPFLRLICGKNN